MARQPRTTYHIVMLKPEFEDGGEVISSMPYANAQSIDLSLTVSLRGLRHQIKPAELSLEQDGPRCCFSPNPQASPCLQFYIQSITTAELPVTPNNSASYIGTD